MKTTIRTLIAISSESVSNLERKKDRENIPKHDLFIYSGPSHFPHKISQNPNPKTLMAKKQSPPPPNPHSPRKVSPKPNPSLMAKKQASPPRNRSLMSKKQASPPPNPSLMAKKQPSPPPNPSLMAKKQAYPPPNPSLMARKQPSPPPNPNLMAKKQPPPPPINPNLMVKKQPPPPSAPPSSSSEDEESSSASNDEEAIIKKPNTQTPTNNEEKQEEETGYETGYETSDDEEGEEVNQPETKTPQPITTAAAIPALKPCDASKKPNGKDDATNEDEENESDSGSDEDEERLSNTKKPQAISMTAATPVLKPCDGGEKPNGKGNASCKAGLFQRIWTLEDEIAILKAIPKFEAKHGPVKINQTGIRPFHDFVKDSLSLEVSDSQLYEKVRRLRRKYKRRANRGNTIRFRRAHDEKAYELSKKIWGTGSSENTEAKIVAISKRAATVLGSDGTGPGSLKRKYPFLTVAMASSIPAELLEAVVDPENARLLEVKFTKQKVEEINNKKCEMKLMIEALDKVLEDIKKATTE